MTTRSGRALEHLRIETDDLVPMVSRLMSVQHCGVNALPGSSKALCCKYGICY